jgi:3-hydroxyanthranilate 3,4-dioxygenase
MIGDGVTRKNTALLLREARRLGPYSEFPVLRPEVDPQLHLSRNDRSQPFFLICEKDCVLVQLAGEAVLDFREVSVSEFNLEVGDHVYIPAGTPHRIRIISESIQYRFKASNSDREAVVWVCESCGAELSRHTWSNEAILPQEGYQAAGEAFNADPERRACRSCGAHHPIVDLSPFAWPDIAAAVRRATQEAAAS